MQMTENAESRKSHARNQFNTIAADYDVGPGCFGHFGRRLVAEAAIEPGHRVLDIASGRGAVLFPCSEQIAPGGEVIGIDFADEMVRVANEDAARRGISASVRVMDAEHLAFSDSSFDRVLCGFGIMFFPDQARALAEFGRVLKPGGRIALSTWRVPQTSELESAMTEVEMQPMRPPGWITEPDVLSKLLATAGFTEISVKVDSHSFRYSDVDQYWRQARGTGMRAALDALTSSDAARLRDALRRRVNPEGSGEFCSTSTALIAVASH
jgi:ubiquinone/menaquinone biosynthesis C-methylase UbiE